ncbi:MAG: Zc3h12a-like Ribonuclease domain [Acidimicrobiaceae bacterium]|nr:Zc3h12a-like Ribonuclease domain [Acidimicrobiaceae bacterium]
MATQHVVVDGSNIATEGRSIPSLDQLEGAVEELRRELPEAEVTVVVDATFAHRIDPDELARFEERALRGEFTYPPAGAIGRGDAFLLRIAEKVDAVVLSNDSFQEFHGEHPWLFERGRLLGATPVPGIGWIFVPRTPVRGPKSRVATRDARKAKVRVEKAIEVATKEVVAPVRERARREPAAARAVSTARAEEAPSRGGRRGASRDGAAAPQAVNDPGTFIAFIAEHRLGEQLEAEVDSFTSHGAVAMYDGVRCYVPLSGLGSPPPRSAREVLRKGERRRFAITALDPYRRGVELALPEVAVVSGRPSEETVAAEVRMARTSGSARVRGGAAAGSPVAADEGRPARSGRRRASAAAASGAEPIAAALEPVGRTSKASSARTSAAKKSAAAKASATKAGAAKVNATKASTAKKSATKTTASKVGAVKVTATKAGAAKKSAANAGAAKTRATARNEAPAKKAAASRASAGGAAATRKAPARVRAAGGAVSEPAEKPTSSRKQASPAKAPARKAGAGKASSVSRAAASSGAPASGRRRTPAKKTVASEPVAPAKRASSKRAPAPAETSRQTRVNALPASAAQASPRRSPAKSAGAKKAGSGGSALGGSRRRRGDG